MKLFRSSIILLVFLLPFPPWVLAQPYLVDEPGQERPTIPPIENHIRLEPELIPGKMVVTWKKNLQIGFPILGLHSAEPFKIIEGKTDLWYFTINRVRPVQYIVLQEPVVWRTKANGKWQGYVRKTYKGCLNYDFVNLHCKN